MKIAGKLRKILLVGVILLTACIVTGCRTINFYAQAAKGQFKLLTARESIDRLLENTNTPPEMRQRFEVLADIRDFAEKELALPVNGHYLTYVDVKRPYVLWNVEAAPELSMAPKRWWYPIVGRQQYRGYFSHSAATNYAAALARDGYDVYVGGVQAYSTLGWFKDSALSTFIFDRDPMLAELIFHELSHQEVFAGGDTDFNEAFATTVGEEAARRWIKARRSPEMLAEYEQVLSRHREFVRIVADARDRLEDLFGDERNEEGDLVPNKQKDRDLQALRSGKEKIYRELLEQYEALKEKWGGMTTYDRWFSNQLNNAKLNSVGAYYDLVPGFEALLELEQYDLPNFYAAAQRLADMPRKERHEWLEIVRQSAEQNPSNPL